MSKRLTVARLEAWFRRLWRQWLGHVAWVAAVLGLAWQVPNPAGAFGIGILFGLLAGKGWRDRLRAERDEANALIDRWNYADSRRALDEADGVAPERKPAAMYEQTEAETLPEVHCGRCGSAVVWVECGFCKGDGCYEAVSGGYVDCHACAGEGGWWMCSQPEDWCQANPMPGRDDVARGNIAQAIAGRPAGEVRLG